MFQTVDELRHGTLGPHSCEADRFSFFFFSARQMALNVVYLYCLYILAVIDVPTNAFHSIVSESH